MALLEEGVPSSGISKKRTKHNETKKFENDFEKLPKEDQQRLIEKFSLTSSKFNQKKGPLPINAKSLNSGTDDECLMQLRFQLSEVLNQQVELRSHEKKLKLLIKKIQRKQTASSMDSGLLNDIEQVSQRLFFKRKRKRVDASLDKVDRSVVCPLWNISKQMERDEVYEERRIRARDAELNHIECETVSEVKKRPPTSMLSQLIDQLDNDEESHSTNFESFAEITANYLLTMPCLSDPKKFNAMEIFHAVENLNSTANMCEVGHVSKMSEEFSDIWNNKAIQWENKLFIAVMFAESTLRIVTSMQNLAVSNSSCLVKGLSDVVHGCVAHYLKASSVASFKCNMHSNQLIDQTFTSECSRLQHQKTLVTSFGKENYDFSQVLGTKEETKLSTKPKMNGLSTTNGGTSASNHLLDVELNSTVTLNELRSYLVKDHYLHQKIVAYIPLELNEVYQKLHEEGIYMPKHQLLKALDALSIFVSTH